MKTRVWIVAAWSAYSRASARVDPVSGKEFIRSPRGVLYTAVLC